MESEVNALRSGEEHPVATGESFEALVQALVTHVNRSDVVREGAPEEVLLDVDIDGVRCLLVSRPEPDDHEVHLSPRERQIVRMVADGLPNKTIARELGISAWTVSTHLRRIFGKLGVNSRAAMVKHAIDHGVLGAAQRRAV